MCSLKHESWKQRAAGVRAARCAFERQVSRSDGTGGDDPPKGCDAGQQRGLVNHQPHVRRLDDAGRQSEQLRLGGVQAGRQLGVPCHELGVVQGSSSLGRSSPLGPQLLKRRIDGAELALQRNAFGRLGGLDATTRARRSATGLRRRRHGLRALTGAGPERPRQMQQDARVHPAMERPRWQRKASAPDTPAAAAAARQAPGGESSPQRAVRAARRAAAVGGSGRRHLRGRRGGRAFGRRGLSQVEVGLLQTVESYKRDRSESSGERRAATVTMSHAAHPSGVGRAYGAAERRAVLWGRGPVSARAGFLLQRHTELAESSRVHRRTRAHRRTQSTTRTTRATRAPRRRP